jgi:23S rRNA pseudouridine1911/1915/1917 synthase
VRVLAVEPEAAGQRLDRYLAVRLAELSRTRIQELIKQGRIRIGGKPTRPSQKVSAGERIEVEAIPRPPLCAVPEPIPLEILYEDADVIAVNKPAGMAVHPATGCATGTLVNALLHRYEQLSSEGGELRPGIVHRLDKATSGVVLVARNDTAHRALADQFRHREVKKIYVALLHGKLKTAAGRIELPVARDLHRRIRMTTRRREGRAARTDWRTLLVMDGFTLVEAGLHTGRTHQIRVHFSALGHPVVGDTLYGAPRQVRAGRQTLPPLGRNFLHAARITFVQPRTGAPVTVRAPLPSELCEYLHRLAAALRIAPTSVDRVLRNYL